MEADATAVTSLTPEQVKEYCFLFQFLDTDKDDHINTSELGTLVRALGFYPSNHEVQNMIQLVDADNSGLVSIEDFLQLMANHVTKTDTEEDVRDAFRVFDKASDSFISVDDLRAILTNFGERLTNSQVDELLQDWDVDNDGQINYDELIKMLMTK